MMRIIFMKNYICKSLAFCLVTTFLLSSSDNSTATEPEFTEMKELFLSVNGQGKTDCSSGNVNVRLTGDESTGKLDITMTSVDLEEGIELDFQYSGHKLIRGSEKTITTSYVGVNSEGDYDSPGMAYFTSTTNNKILQGEAPAMMFAGFWIGEPSRIKDHPLVLCPHVLIPRDAIDTNGMPITCGGSDGEKMSEGLRDYLGTESGEGLGACYKTLDGTRLLAPMAVQ